MTNSLENEQLELKDKAFIRKTLIMAFVSFAILVLAGMIVFWGVESFYPGKRPQNVLVLLLAFYILTITAGIMAIRTLIKSIAAIRKYKDKRSYLSMLICIIVLLLILGEIKSRL